MYVCLSVLLGFCAVMAMAAKLSLSCSVSPALFLVGSDRWLVCLFAGTWNRAGSLVEIEAARLAG